jgi:hypothetical protein
VGDFSSEKGCLNFDENGLCYILGDFIQTDLVILISSPCQSSRSTEKHPHDFGLNGLYVFNGLKTTWLCLFFIGLKTTCLWLESAVSSLNQHSNLLYGPSKRCHGFQISPGVL